MKTLSLPQRWRITIFRGFLLTCKTILATLVIALENLAQSRHRFLSQTTKSLETQAQQIGVSLINFYQKYISPYEGFACAHRVLHGGDSCSQHVKNLLIEQDLQSAIGLSRQRFQACKDARIILHYEKANRRDAKKFQKKKQSKNNQFLDNCYCEVIEFPCSDELECCDTDFDCSPDCGDCASCIDCTPGFDCG